jgi:hypothetical protein
MFKGERLFVHRSCASDFLIHNCFIGSNHGGGKVNFATPLIAEPFAVDFDQLTKIDLFDGKDAIKITIDRKAIEFCGAPFPLPTMHPGMQMSMQVENIGREPRRFLGAFFGRANWR